MARGLTRHEAEAASAQLNQHGIAVSTSADAQQAERFQLEVAESAVAQAVAALAPRAQVLPNDAPRRLPLVPMRTAEARAREEELDAKLRQLVRSVPGVVEVAVQSTIVPARESLDDLRAAPPPAAIRLDVQLVREPDAPGLGQRVRALILQRVPELAHATIAIDERALPRVSSSCAPLTHLGPITLTPSSLSTLKLWLGASLLVHMLSAVALIVVLRRSQRLRRGSLDAPD